MASITKSTHKESLVNTCVTTLVGGYAIAAMYPPFDNIGMLMKCTGVIGLAYYAWKWSKFDKIFKNLGLGMGTSYPLYKSRKITEHSTIYRFTLPCGLSLKDFDDNKDAIEQYLGKEINIKYTYKEIQIEVYKDKAKTLYEYEPVKIKGDVPIIIGYNRYSELVTCDLSDGEPHMLIAGETGSGKSTVLRSIITNLILQSQVKLHLVDLKMGAEFNIFSKSNKVISFGRTIKEANDILTQLSTEVDRRYNIFFKNELKDIKDYNHKFKRNQMDYQILIIDEFADLQSEKDSMRLIEDLGRKARACGIHLILSTQRPDHKVLTGNIKVNVGTVLGLKTLNSTNSSIIIDDTGLEKLRGKGHGLFKRGTMTEIQAPYVTTDEVKELIKHTYVNKPTHVIETTNGNINETDCVEAINNL